MSENKQNRSQGFRMFTEEEKQAMLKQSAEHEQRLKTDPEYKKRWEKNMRVIRAIEHNYEDN